MSAEKVAVATMAILLLVASSATALVVAETRRHISAVEFDKGSLAVEKIAANNATTSQAPIPTYTMCPDGSTVPSGQACPVHHTRVS